MALLALLTGAAAPWAAAAVRQPTPATGSIRGRLDIRRLASPPQPRPTVGEHGGRAGRGLADVRRGLVYLDTAPRRAFDDPEPTRAVMDQRNETFVPRLVAITAGSVVDFPNSDRTYHNVFSLSRARRFDLGRYASGRSKAVRFDRPGVVRVFCDIHSHMSAFVVVFTHPFFRVTDPDGRYRLDQVPPGTYTVVGWYEGEARVQRSVSVAAGAVVELDLEVP
ncbi:MAG: carboxypeptidase regulatory-like domain-containing protein [Vicinamibacterales bacterium]